MMSTISEIATTRFKVTQDFMALILITLVFRNKKEVISLAVGLSSFTGRTIPFFPKFDFFLSLS